MDDAQPAETTAVVASVIASRVEVSRQSRFATLCMGGGHEFRTPSHAIFTQKRLTDVGFDVRDLRFTHRTHGHLVSTKGKIARGELP